MPPHGPLPEFWINPRSPASGKERPAELIAAARQIWRFVHEYCAEILGDADSAGELLERAVSRVERRKPGAQPIDDLAGYLARVAVRQIRQEFARQSKVLPLGSDVDLIPSTRDLPPERGILAGQILALVREEMLDVFLRRLSGLSWDEIAELLGGDAHTLEARYSYEIGRIRAKLGLRPPRRDKGS